MKQIHVGLIGYGTAGRIFHAPVLTAVDGLHLKSVVERNSEISKLHYPHVNIVRSAEELVNDPEIDLIVIATPNTSHAGLAKLALEHGKHVVVDKPFTVRSEEAKELVRLARANGQVLSVFHNRRWDGDFMTVRHLIEKGLLGKVVEYEVHFDRYRPKLKQGAWREEEGPGNGLLYDLGSHLIDQALVLFGKPSTVYGDLRKQRDGAKTDDYFEVQLGYDGVKVTLKAGMLVREPGPHFIVHGTEGSFVKYGMDPQEEALKQGRVPSSPGWGEDSRPMWGTLNTNVSGLHVEGKVETLPGAYQDYYRDIYEAITEGREPAVRADQALDVIQCIELAAQSSAQGAAVSFVRS